MACNVVTGYTVTGNPVPESSCVTVSPGKTILFSPETPQDTKFSAPFLVSAGDAVIIDAYNLVENEKIFVNRLVMSSYCRPRGNNCNADDMAGAYGRDGTISFEERMTMGNAPERWSLLNDSDNPRLQLLIAVPGLYRLEIEHPDIVLADGLLEVEYLRFKTADMSIPDCYHAGISIPRGN